MKSKFSSGEFLCPVKFLISRFHPFVPFDADGSKVYRCSAGLLSEKIVCSGGLTWRWFMFTCESGWTQSWSLQATCRISPNLCSVFTWLFMLLRAEIERRTEKGHNSLSPPQPHACWTAFVCTQQKCCLKMKCSLLSYHVHIIGFCVCKLEASFLTQSFASFFWKNKSPSKSFKY